MGGDTLFRLENSQQKPVDHDHTQVIDPPQSEKPTTSQLDPIVLQSKRRFLL